MGKFSILTRGLFPSPGKSITRRRDGCIGVGDELGKILGGARKNEYPLKSITSGVTGGWDSEEPNARVSGFFYPKSLVGIHFI